MNTHSAFAALLVSTLFGSLSVACGGAPDSEPAASESDLTSFGTPRKEGEICGGVANFKCEKGLVCNIKPANHSDPTGKCEKPAPKPGEEDGMCGGIAGIACTKGLECVMTGTMHPDKAGTCKPKPLAQEGDHCGGFTANPIQCDKGLLCQASDINPDFPGTCVEDPEGKMCGGIAGISCPKGYRCAMGKITHPDQAGHCELE